VRRHLWAEGRRCRVGEFSSAIVATFMEGRSVRAQFPDELWNRTRPDAGKRFLPFAPIRLMVEKKEFPTGVDGDVRALQQVLLNLLQNGLPSSMKAVHPGRTDRAGTDRRSLLHANRKHRRRVGASEVWGRTGGAALAFSAARFRAHIRSIFYLLPAAGLGNRPRSGNRAGVCAAARWNGPWFSAPTNGGHRVFLGIFPAGCRGRNTNPAAASPRGFSRLPHLRCRAKTAIPREKTNLLPLLPVAGCSSNDRSTVAVLISDVSA